MSLQTETTNKADFLTVHGLWPDCLNRLLPVVLMNAAGCASVRYSPNPESARSTCQPDVFIAETGLSLETAAKLSEVMPGAADVPAWNATNMPNTVPALVLSRRILRHDGTSESRN